MPDMLVKLYELPDSAPLYTQLQDQGITLRRALASERYIVIDWVREHFSRSWAGECESAFARVPVSCFIATREEKMIGFGCYEVTLRDFFGPTGVQEDQRGLGIGKALLYKCLEAMRAEGYGYAVIGWAGPVDFYRKACNAQVIEGSTPGVYAGLLREAPAEGRA